MFIDDPAAKSGGGRQSPGLREALAMLCDTARICNAPAGLPTIAHRLLVRVVDFDGWRGGSIHVGPTAESATMVARVCTAPERTDAQDMLGMMNEALLAKVLATGEAVWQQTEFDEFSGGAVTGLCAPIGLDGSPLGAMTLIAASRPTPSEIIRYAIETAAVQLGIAIERWELDRRIASAATAEQERIGRDLHDSISQELASAALLGDGLAASLAHDGRSEAETAERIAAAVRRSIKGLHGIVEGLLPVGLQETGLEAALKQLARLIDERYGVRCEVRGDAGMLSKVQSEQLYFIASEALYNAAEHAEAGLIRVSLMGNERSIRMEIADDGRGLSEGDAAGNGRGMTIMRHRARLIDGSLSVEPLDGRGTIVVCEAPRLLAGDWTSPVEGGSSGGGGGR